jgi:hypothetical protein
MTPEEQRAALDGRLRVALGEFDEMLLGQQRDLEEKQRQDPVQGREDPGRAGGSGGGGMQGERAGSSSEDEAGGGSNDNSRGGGGPEGDSRATGGAAGQEGGSDPRVPSDVGDGRGDDIVARQLREAALKEEDPELRDRLWDEYREYKKSSGGS